MASAPPDPPSPMTTLMTGTLKLNISLRFLAIASPYKWIIWYSLPIKQDYLTQLFCLYPSVGSRSIDEGDDRQSEFICVLHKSQSLSESKRLGHPEVSFYVLSRVSALLVANKHTRNPAQFPDSAYYSLVIVTCSVSVKLYKFVCNAENDVEGCRPFRMPGNLRTLVGSQFSICLLS